MNCLFFKKEKKQETKKDTPLMETKQKRSVLVLGANGFIGYAVAIAFARAGYKTYGLIRQEKFADHLAFQEVIPVIGDNKNTEWVEKLGPIDVIVNATGSRENDPHFLDDLFGAVTRVAKKQSKKPLYIQTSGLKIYGDTGRADEKRCHAASEESPYNPTPKSMIGPHIHIIERFMSSNDFYSAVIFPGMIYGRGQSGYGTFIKQAVNGDKIMAFGKADSIWQGVHVDDLADAYVRLGDLGEKAHKKKYNVANDKYESLGDILKTVSAHFGGKHKIIYMNYEADSFGELMGMSTWVKNDKAKKELGWRPKKVNFIEGIEENVVAWKASIKNDLIPTY